MNDKLHGQAAAFSETGEGKAAVFNAQMDQLSDNLGKTLLPALNFVLDALNKFAGVLKKHPDLVIALTIALGGLAAALLLVSAATIIVEAAMSPILVPLAAVVIAVGVLSYVTYKLVTDFRHNWPLLLPIVLGPLGAIILAVEKWHTQIIGFFTAAWNAVKSVTTAAVGVVLGAVGSLDGVLGALKTAFNAVRTAAEAVAGFLKGALVGALNTVKGPLGVVRGVAAGLADGFWAVVHAVEALIGALGRIHVPHISIPGAGILGKLHVPGFAEGGLVPGALGAPMLAMVHGGETVIPAGGGAGGGITVNVYVSGSVTSEQNLAESVRRSLLRTQGRNGTLGFT